MSFFPFFCLKFSGYSKPTMSTNTCACPFDEYQSRSGLFPHLLPQNNAQVSPCFFHPLHLLLPIFCIHNYYNIPIYITFLLLVLFVVLSLPRCQTKQGFDTHTRSHSSPYLHLMCSLSSLVMPHFSVFVIPPNPFPVRVIFLSFPLWLT